MLKRNLSYRLAIFLVKYQDYQVHTSTYLIKFIFWWIKIDKLTIRDRHLVILEEIWMRLQKHLWLFYWWEQFVPLEFCHTNIIKSGTIFFKFSYCLKLLNSKLNPRQFQVKIEGIWSYPNSKLWQSHVYWTAYTCRKIWINSKSLNLNWWRMKQ